VLTANDTVLTVSAPVGTTFQAITVTVNGLTAYAPEPFSLTIPGGSTGIAASTFAPRQSFSLTQSPNFLASGDLDGDGRADLVVAVQSSGTGVQVLRNTSTSTAISFAAPVILSSTTVGMTTTLGDLDHDGRLDIVMSDHSNKVTVYRNTSSPGSISFAGGLIVTLGGSSRGIAIGDLNGDGKAEMVVTNQNQNFIAVFRNTSTAPGTISFAAVQTFITPSLPYTVAISDVDGDAKSDIVVANAGGASFSVFRNTTTTGTITLSTRQDFSAGVAPYGLCLVDLDDDGLEEVAVVNSNANTLMLFENTSDPGSVSFEAPVTFSTLSAPRCVSAGDIDGDEDIDLVVGYNFSATNVSVFQNTSILGSLTLSPPVHLALNGSSSFSVVLCDLENDGKTDISTTVSNGLTYRVAMFRNKANEPIVNSFTPTTAQVGVTVTIRGRNFTGATAVRFGGVPATSFTIVSDTSITAVVGTGASGAVSVTNGFGTGSATGFTYLLTPTITAFSPAAARTRKDTVTITGTALNTTTIVRFGGVNAAWFTIVSPTQIRALVGNGASGSVSVSNGSFSTSLSGFTYLPPIVPNFTYNPSGYIFAPVQIQFTDSTTAPTPIISHAWNFGNGQIATTQNPVVTYSSPGIYTVTLAVAEADTTAFVSKTIQVYAPPPVISTITPLSGAVGTTVTIRGIRFSATAANNIVHFGAVRAVVTSASDSSLVVTVPIGATHQPVTVTVGGLTAFSPQPFLPTFAGAGTVYFAPRSDSTLFTTPFGVVAADFNTDGKTDLAFTNNAANTVAVFRNTSIPDSIRLAPRINATVGSAPSYLAAGDLDGDGLPDLVVPNSQAPGTISVLRNTSSGGNISFAPKIDFTTVGYSFPNNVVIRDLNSDGRPDMVVSDSTNKIYVFENRGSTGSIAFASPMALSSIFNSSFIAIEDLDRDGRTDLTIVSDYGNKAIVFRNTTTNGVLSFAPYTDFVVGNYPKSVALADLNGDGKPDMITANNLGQSVSLLRNTSTPGTISFAPRTDSAVGSFPIHIAIGDMDGDGRPDIVAGNSGSNNIAVW
jgi:PKD repeat protein